MGRFDLNPKAPSRMVVTGAGRFSRETAGLVLSLVASSTLGLTVAGSRTGLAAVFLGLLTLSSLILSPVCAKRSGYRAAIGVAAITVLSSVVTLFSTSIYGLISFEGFGTALWGFIQIVVVKFAYDAYRENKTRLRSIGALQFVSQPVVG